MKKRKTFKRSGPAGAPPRPGKNDPRSGNGALKKNFPLGDS